jgi:hypothetical protein
MIEEVNKVPLTSIRDIHSCELLAKLGELLTGSLMTNFVFRFLFGKIGKSG